MKLRVKLLKTEPVAYSEISPFAHGDCKEPGRESQRGLTSCIPLPWRGAPNAVSVSAGSITPISALPTKLQIFQVCQ